MRRIKELWFATLEGVRFYFCIVPFGWWKKSPFLPLPSRRYITWRLDTAYGQVDHGWERPKWKEITAGAIRFLLWRRKNRLARKRR